MAISINDAKNLLVDWLNKKQATNVQTNTLKNSATNTKNTWIKLPNSTASTDLKTWTKNKLQEKGLIQPTTTTTTQNKQTKQQILDNNSTVQKLKQLSLQNNVNYVANQQNQGSRFIWFQNNNQTRPLTDLAWNIIQENLDAKRKSEFDRILSKPVLNIPTKKAEIEEYNKKESERYRTDEQVIKDFHYDVRNSNWTLTKEQISQLYPEFQGKEDIALMLQADLLPLVQNNEFADMKKVAEIYPELLSKQKKVWDAILKQQEKEWKEIKELSKRAEETLSRYNTLSKNWVKYMEDVYQIWNYVDMIRAEYRLPWNPSDIDIINFGKKNIPEVKEILDDMERLKSNFYLTEEDRNVIFKNWFDLWDWLLQAWADIQNFMGNNKLSNYVNDNSSKWSRQLMNAWISPTAWELPKDVYSKVSIPVNMVWDLSSWLWKVSIATERIAKQQNRNEDWTTDMNWITQDLIKWWGWALSVAFNTVMAIPTAIFHLAEDTDAGSAAIDGTLWKMQKELDNLQSWKTTNSDNAFTQWYNWLDEEAKADLLNEEIMAIFHYVHKWSWKVKKVWSFEIKSAKNAINDVIRQKYSIESNNANFKAKVEQGLADGTMKVTDDWKLTDRDWNNIGKVKVHKIKTKDKIKYVVDKVISDNRAARNAKSLWELNPNALPDNRTFREKSEEKAYNAGVKTREIYDTAKEWIDTVKKWVKSINVWNTVKGTSEMAGKGVKATSDLYNAWKNVLSKWKNKITSTVKNTINENIVEPYRKGRWKTNQLNTEWINQWWQVQESNSTLKTDTKINWDNYNQKKTNSKKLNKAQLQLLQTNNRMNPKSIDTFKEWYGTEYWQRMYDRWFTKSAEWGNLKEMENYKDSLLSQKRETLNKIEWTYQDISLSDMADHLVEKAETVRNRKLLKEAKKLRDKHNETWLTMPEADRLRVLFTQNVKMWFHQDIPADARERAKNEYLAVKDFLDDIWRKNWFDDLDRINREIQQVQHIIKWVESKMNRQSANNEYTLTDYILMAEAFTSPESAALFTAKQILKHPKVRNAILDKAVWGKKNSQNKITADTRKATNENVENIAKAKRWEKLQSDLSRSDIKWLPYKWWADNGKNILAGGKTIITDWQWNSWVKGQITEIDKRKTTSEDTTPPTDNTPTDKTEKTDKTPKKKSESKSKNKVTSKKSAITEEKTETKEEKKTEQPKEEKQLETRVETKQPEPKWQAVDSDNIKTYWSDYVLDNMYGQKGITNKSWKKVKTVQLHWREWGDIDIDKLTTPPEWVDFMDYQIDKWDRHIIVDKDGNVYKVLHWSLGMDFDSFFNWIIKRWESWLDADIVERLEGHNQYMKSQWWGFKDDYNKLLENKNKILNWEAKEWWKKTNKDFIEFIEWKNKPTKNIVTEKAEITTKSEAKTEIKEKDEITWQDKAYTTKDSKKLWETRTLNDLKNEFWLETFHDSLPVVNAHTMKQEWGIEKDYYYGRIWDTNVILSKYNNYERKANPTAPEFKYEAWIDWTIIWGDNWVPPMMPRASKYYEWGDSSVVIDWIKEYLDKQYNIGTPKTTTEVTWEKSEVTSKTTEEKPKNLVTNKPVDNSSITGKFRDLTLQDYKEMQKYQWVENALINGDEEWYITGKIKAEMLNEEDPLIPWAEINELEFYPVNYEDLKKLVDEKDRIEAEERKLTKANGENLSQQIEDLRYNYENEMLPSLWIYGVDDVDTAVNIIKSTMSEAHFQFRKDSEWIKPLVDKYWEYRNQWKGVAKSENTNIIGKNNTLTSKNNNNGTNLWRNEQTVWQSNWGKEWELRNAVSDMQSAKSTETWLQRTSDTNGNGELNTSWKQADISWNGLRPWHESTRLTVWEQRKINEQSRAILEKHNFSTNRSDYTPEELETLFKYEWNGGLAKAGDENVKGTRYEFYTPKNAVSALQRWIQKYSDSPINSVEDPTAWKWNMLDWYGENIDKYMYEISPVSWTIAKLRFPEAKVWIWEKDGDFQRRYLNYQWEKAYDTPRDWWHNVDAVLLNPPFWKRITIKDEPQIKSLEDYFTKRSIEHDLKDWWMVGLLMPSRWLKASDSYTKKWLDWHTQIVDAYRLPAWVFSYTDVGTDLIILKKVSWADNKWWFIDDNYFKENPDKVLWVEKERTWRHWMETYIEWDPKVIETLRQDSDIVPSQMNAVTDTTNKTAITSKKTVENKPKNLVTNPPKEDAKFTPTEETTTTEKPKAEKKPTTRKSKNAKQTISKWDKTDIGTYTVNWNEKAYEYQDATDADGFIDRTKLSISPKEVAEWIDLLNYIDGRIQTDYLYYSWDIYAKLKQLEKDKPQMSDTQYKKQKEWLQAILPEKLSVRDITWSPTDKLLLSEMTDELETHRDSTTREDVTEPITIKDSFKKRIRKLWSEQFEWTDTNKWKIMDYVDGKRWSSERITQRYSETDEEFEMRKKAKKAEEEQKKQATKARAKTFFNDFIKEQLSPEIQDKITESYNTRLRAVVKPDYKNMPLSVKNMSATFHGKPLKIDPVQIEWINAMLSKWTMLIAHWVGYGKTLEWVVATIGSVQKGWTKKPLFIVPKWTREDWIKTIHDLFPNQEIVDLWWLTVDDIKRLKRDLGNDVNNWIKDWQVAIITHNWFDNKINFKKESQNSLEWDLRDVMDNDNNTARQEDSLAENIQNIAETVNAKKDTKKLKWIKATLSDKYGDKLLEELDKELENMNEVEFVENFVSKTEWMFKEEELRKDAHDMYETKPIYIEDLGIDHITVDEVHNYKNIFTSAKSNYKKWEWPEEVNPYGKISGSSSARGRKMFATSQYILKNNGWRWVFSLSATPFNNQPIEVYNMLSLHAYNRLVEKWIQNINSFFDYFANFRSEWISNPLKKWWWEFGEVMKDFNNLPEMQRLVWEYIDYVWDNPNLVRPEKRMKKVILTPSDMQREIQQRLQKEEKRLNANWEWDSVLPIYNDMRLNIISPYLTSYWKLYNTPTWEEFIESSPKLKFAVDTIKALRDEGQNDWVFIYMPLWVEYHSLLKEAIENIVGRDKVKVWIINWGTTWTETVDWEKVEKRIAIADRFRKWELNVLIWWRNTSEWINLQDNWFITINTLIWWNPTEITQLNGRIHRQWNLRDHVIELLPLLTDWADIMMMQKYDEKANRINNIFESQGRTFNLEELDPEEEKMALNTDPVRKAELSIDMDKKRIQRDIQKLSWQNWTLREVIQKMPKEETIKEQEERISKAQEELKWINEWMKALSPDSTAYRTLESQRDYTERNIKWEKERLKKLEKDKARAEARMQSYSIDSIEWVNQRIAENDAKLDDLIEQEKNLQNELNERIDKYTKEQKEWEANMKTAKEYLEELKEDFRSKKIFGDREELKQHLEEQKKQKEESKNKVTSNWKNNITNGKTMAARSYSPTIVMRLDNNGNPIKTAKNKVTSRKKTENNSDSKFSPELVKKIDKVANSKGIEWNTLKKMKILNKTVDKGKWYQTDAEREIYDLKKQIITEYVKSNWNEILDRWYGNTIVEIRQWKTRVKRHIVGKLYKELKKQWIKDLE